MEYLSAESPNLIIESQEENRQPTDINFGTYSQQVGGYACYQREVTGYLEAFGDAALEEALLEFFTSDIWGGWCAFGFHDLGPEVEKKTIETMESLFHPYGRDIHVDKDRISESMEAWVYVRVDGKPGVLTWGNSD